MNILLVTNTYTPHVGGVARSVEAFAGEYRRRGHQVLVVAPEFPDMPADETGVLRVPAIQEFNASDFSVVLPTHPPLTAALDAFGPDIVHSQHPFLLGSTAVRIARYRGLPLVFTHHTLYEQYTHYVPGDSPALKRFTVELATRYANLCDQVFAPSQSIRDLLRERGVRTPIEVVPTGVHIERFAQGDGATVRAQAGIPADALVVGHLGRLAPEKNLALLAEAVAQFIAAEPKAHFLVVGSGPSADEMRAIFATAGVEARLHFAGTLQGQALADALHAMDLFAFASKSETQGMVLTEAMAAGLPVIALDAAGVREVVSDCENGRLLREETPEAFTAALRWAAALDDDASAALRQSALETAAAYSMEQSATTALECYRAVRVRSADEFEPAQNLWEEILGALRTEWSLFMNLAGASDAALGGERDPGEPR
ncbi:glycosyltransferase [Thioalkalivibrio sp. XN279]|uniref:glycosyltransferase n=1 Tax=Thioalkalivibrio sp. XN279 TaxID=2714953 RepID=UPI0014090CF0|nr:glycosyltransferase [Thioalkalivibrio sp. XN279]NHA15407.1 glycosyltransferase family 4 protein [Thioalkalivibrio sp. XN279]